MEFYPPDQLPPLHNVEGAPKLRPTSLRRKVVCVAAFFSAGLLIAGLGVSWTASPVWLAAIPSAAAVGWLVVLNPGRLLLGWSKPRGTVLW